VLVGRPRPQVGQLVSTATGFAFPSGHATQIAAITITIAMLGSTLSLSRSRMVMVWGATALTVLVVGVSRIYLGVHWPTDVLAGSALGALWAVVTARALHPFAASLQSR
jgi:membrane-associated phospholipid phosphatase